MSLNIYSILFLTLFSFNLFGQEVIDPASLPEVESYTQVQTNPNADTVILVLHGGPTDYLVSGTFFYLEQIPSFSVVEVSKHEMLSDVLLNPSFTFEQGVAVNDTTAALIEKAVQFYNDQDKTVVLVGHSWGAILLGEYMDDYGVDNIHKIIPMEGRLSVQQEFVDYLLDGYLPTFGADGYSLELSTPQNEYGPGILNLGAAAFANRWVDSLANLDLSKMMYTYSEFDMQTGALLEEETTFLDNSGARTLVVQFGNHGDSYSEEYQEIIVEFIRESLPTDIPAIANLNLPLKLYPTLASNSINIDSNHSGILTIYDMMGRSVFQINVDDLSFPVQVNTASFRNGQYFAVLLSDNKLSSAKFQVVN